MEGTSHQRRLYHDSAAQYMSKRKTMDSITEMHWNEERGQLSHEYLLFCVTSGIANKKSWMRVERMGDLPAAAMDLMIINPFDVLSGGLTITFARTKEELHHSDDKEIMRPLIWDSHPTKGKRAPPLHRISGLFLVVDQEHGYTFTLFNCWWYARETFTMIVENFWADTRSIWNTIRMKERNQLLLHTTSSVTAPINLATSVPGGIVLGPALALGFCVPVLGQAAFAGVMAYKYGAGSIRFDINHENIRRRFSTLD
jgi:hypothetical protein